MARRGNGNAGTDLEQVAAEHGSVIEVPRAASMMSRRLRGERPAELFHARQILAQGPLENFRLLPNLCQH